MLESLCVNIAAEARVHCCFSCCGFYTIFASILKITGQFDRICTSLSFGKNLCNSLSINLIFCLNTKLHGADVLFLHCYYCSVENHRMEHSVSLASLKEFM